MKAGKAAGPDKLKPQLFKALAKNDTCVQAFKTSMNKILQTREIPERWKMSKTLMIPKVKNPKAKNLRPISLTNVSQKMFMKIVRDRIESDVKVTKEEKEEQSGFTTGKQIKHNIYMVQQCIRKTYKRRKQLLIAAINFKKAYHYVNRQQLIQAVMTYEIEYVKEIYRNDTTSIRLNEQNEITIEITNGIRQD